MSSPLPNLTYAIVGIGAALIIAKLAQPSKLDAIPTAGPGGRLGFWWGSLKYLTSGLDTIQEGYEKHNLRPFKMATLSDWMVLLSDREHVEELQRAPDDTLSLADDLLDQLQTVYTMGPEIHYNPYHISIVRSKLTRNIGSLYPEIRNEITTAFDEVLDLKGNEWKSFPVLRTVQQVVCRTSNRVFVGLPLCRNPDWIDLNVRYTIDVVKGTYVLALFPKLLKPIATRLFTSIHQSKQRGRKLLGPIIEERQRHLDEYGNEWAEKPNDFLAWLMEEAEGPESTVEFLTTRILVLNFAAIHTTSSAFTQALFYLATSPQYIQPLREEVEDIVEKEGWSKASLSKMRKVDSFLKECQRMEGLGALGSSRKAVRDFTFSDGTFLPKGTRVGIAMRPVHYDDKHYENANVFQPFRFAEMDEEGGEGGKHQFVSIGSDYLVFGLGKHACPGRFFAANELKTMLAHIVTMYDVKLEDGAAAPRNLRFFTAITPDPSAKIMFRRRVE